MVTKLIVRRLYTDTFADMARMEDELARSDLDWLVIGQKAIAGAVVERLTS